jgi:hypothetical protein
LTHYVKVLERGTRATDRLLSKERSAAADCAAAMECIFDRLRVGAAIAAGATRHVRRVRGRRRGEKTTPPLATTIALNLTAVAAVVATGFHRLHLIHLRRILAAATNATTTRAALALVVTALTAASHASAAFSEAGLALTATALATAALDRAGAAFALTTNTVALTFAAFDARTVAFVARTAAAIMAGTHGPQCRHKPNVPQSAVRRLTRKRPNPPRTCLQRVWSGLTRRCGPALHVPHVAHASNRASQASLLVGVSRSA